MSFMTTTTPTSNRHPNRNDALGKAIRAGSIDATIATSEDDSSTSTISDSFVDRAVFRWSDSLEMGPPDPILGIAQNYRASTAPHKVNLVIGAYRDSAGSPWILPTVAAAEQTLLRKQKENPGSANKEYLPIEGDAEFVKQAVEFAYGSDLVAQRSIAAVQTLSGTGACRIGGELLSRTLPTGTHIYIPVPTWGNHWKIFGNCHGLVMKPYRYYGMATNQLDIAGLLEDLEAAPSGSVVLLHACAHNPTGCDPTPAQWKEVTQVLRNRGHLAFLDSAYQGFASGDAERDAQALRKLVQQGDIPVILAQSFAKNFGLYGERCGTLSVVCENKQERDIVLSQLKGIIRPMYSSPPKHGSNIVKTVLSDAALTEQYYRECQTMASRIGAMRARLVKELKEAGSAHDWSHVGSQIGMFAFTGMPSEMVDELTREHEIYLTRDGRISLAGLNEHNVQTVAKAIHQVTQGRSITSN